MVSNVTPLFGPLSCEHKGTKTRAISFSGPLARFLAVPRTTLVDV